MKTWLWASFFLLFFLAIGAEGRASSESGQLIRLQVGTFDPLTEAEPLPPDGASLQSDEASGPYYIVQFNGPVEETWTDQIEQLGAELLGYVPDNAYVARIGPDDLPKVEAMYAVRWVGQYRPAYKVASELSRGSRLATDESLELVVMTFPGEPAAALEQHLSDIGARIYEISDTPLGLVAHISVNPASLSQLSQYPGISWIEPYIQPELYNAEARKIMGAEHVWQDTGFYGAGQIIAVADSGLSVQDSLSADFAGRLVRAYTPAEMLPTNAACRSKPNWTDLNGHGTHVAGSVLGNGHNSGSNSDAHQYTNSHAGIAPEARLVFMALNLDGQNIMHCIPTNGNYIAFGYDNGARISSNSWGENSNGVYTSRASVVDDYIWKNRDYLVLYAAGNQGPNSRTVGSPGTAKNVLTVGATENNRSDVGQLSNGSNIADNPLEIASFSSRGATEDGRVKPDIVAPGTFILSTRAASAPDSNFWRGFDSNYAYMGGTSMATPLTAGAAALVREWLQTERNILEPSTALLKALLIHGAVQLPDAATPNMNSGWGRVDLKNTLDGQYEIFHDNQEGLRTGQVMTYTITIAGANSMGTLFVTPGQPDASAIDTLRLTALPAGSQTAAMEPPDTASFSLTAVPGYDAPTNDHPIHDAGAEPRGAQEPVPGTFLQIDPHTAPPLESSSNSTASLQSFLQSMVGGGDFEDPAWTNVWSKVWLGEGIPQRTSAGYGIVLRGSHSIWLGGSPYDDTISYPLSFPQSIDSIYPSTLSFLVDMRNADPGYDYFCVAMTDASGNLLGSGDSLIGACGDNLSSGEHWINIVLTATQRQMLAGKTGYLNLMTFGDHLEPHMSAFVDDIAFTIDFPDVTLETVPGAGQAGTTFMLVGANNVPYGPVDICVSSCSVATNRLDTVYADARGDIKTYLKTSSSIPPGTYTIETQNNIDGIALAQGSTGRTARATFTIQAARPPTLQVTPASGPAGTEFIFEGTDLLPNDNNIVVHVNGINLGTVGSNIAGAVRFRITTSSNTPAAVYEVTITDSTGRSATARYEVTEVAASTPQMSVSPQSGAPGTSFVFEGSGFVANEQVNFTLDAQPVGSVSANSAGSFRVTLTMNTQTLPGDYALTASQGQRQATATFKITGSSNGGGDGTAPSGAGIYATLVWTDPPANPQSSRALVNNLNLRIEGLDGSYYGNGGNSPDTVNNVETIRLEQPVPGSYTIVVEAQNVSPIYGMQPYALVVTTAQSYNASSNNAAIGDTPTTQHRLFLPLLRW